MTWPVTSPVTGRVTCFLSLIPNRCHVTRGFCLILVIELTSKQGPCLNFPRSAAPLDPWKIWLFLIALTLLLENPKLKYYGKIFWFLEIFGLPAVSQTVQAVQAVIQTVRQNQMLMEMLRKLQHKSVWNVHDAFDEPQKAHAFQKRLTLTRIESNCTPPTGSWLAQLTHVTLVTNDLRNRVWEKDVV